MQCHALLEATFGGWEFKSKSNNKELANDQFPNESWRKEAKFSRFMRCLWCQIAVFCQYCSGIIISKFCSQQEGGGITLQFYIQQQIRHQLPSNNYILLLGMYKDIRQHRSPAGVGVVRMLWVHVCRQYAVTYIAVQIKIHIRIQSSMYVSCTFNKLSYQCLDRTPCVACQGEKYLLFGIRRIFQLYSRRLTASS